MEKTEKTAANAAGLSFGYRGVAEPRKEWVGKWYKPWTWRKYVYVIARIDFVSIDFVSPPNASLNLSGDEPE
jgi:hypothetical protein